MSSHPNHVLTCPLCGQPHNAITLATGEIARCVRCDSRLVTGPPRGGPHAAVAYALAGLAFAVPAALLPFITLDKFGNARTGDFIASVSALDSFGMSPLAVWVLLCGGLVPLLFLLALACGRSCGKTGFVVGDTLTHWAMPEVYVLAVFVALTRLGSIVDVELNAGFWSYAAFSLALSLAWRSSRPSPPSHSAA